MFVKNKTNMKALILLVVSIFTFSQPIRNLGNLVLSITRYMQWPIKENEKFFRIVVYGNFDLYKSISESVSGKNVGQLNIEVAKINRIEEINYTKPHIIILSLEHCNKEIINYVKQNSSNNSILIIGIKEKSIELGTDVELTMNVEKINFKINTESINKKGIKVSKQLEIMQNN